MKPLQIEGSFDLLICDCDGVIVDSEIVCERILAVALEEAYRGHDLAPVLAGSFGLQITDILDRVAAHLGEALPEGFLERLDREIVAALHREAAAIEGSRSGVTAALAAGMSVIGFLGASHVPARHGEALLALGVRRLVAHMEDLPGAVTELQRSQGSRLATTA